jgi:hypothetical protein
MLRGHADDLFKSFCGALLRAGHSCPLSDDTCRKLTRFPQLTANTALFLDFDGTLVDLAAQPELVVVPQGLTPLLAQLSERLNGALAIVSGRSLADLDGFLTPLKLPCAAEHGAVCRLAGGQPVAAASPRHWPHSTLVCGLKSKPMLSPCTSGMRLNWNHCAWRRWLKP